VVSIFVFLNLRSAELNLFVAEVGDDFEETSEGGDVAVQDVNAREFTVLDLADPSGGDPHHLGDCSLQWAAIEAFAEKLGMGTEETLRKWVRRAEVDSGQRAGVTSEEHAETTRLKREVADLRWANEILKAASVFFAAELDGHSGAREAVFAVLYRRRAPGQGPAGSVGR
jgi:transposase